MATFLDLAGEDAPAAPPPKKSFLDLAGGDAPKKQKQPQPTGNIAPQFDTNDPAAMRAAIAASNDPQKDQLLASFDAQFPPSRAGAGRGMMPASAYAPPQTLPGIPEPNGTAAPVEPSWWQKARAAAEAGANTLIGGPGAIAGSVYGGLEAIGKNAGNAATGIAQLATGQPVTQKPVADIGEQMAMRARQFTPELPKALQTPLGQEYTGKVAEAAQNLAAVAPLAEFQAGVQGIGPAKQAIGDKANASMDAMRQSFAEKAGAGARVEPTFEKPLYRQVNGQWQQVQPAATTSAKGGGQYASNAAAEAPKGTVPFDSAPIEGGLPKQAASQRAEVLRRIGLEKARASALEGDMAKAGTDFQVSKYTGEPAGLEAKSLFDTERQALVTHGEKSVLKTGGTLGLDQDALNVRGQTIAAPFDGLRQWFNEAKTNLYKEADQRSGGLPTVAVEPIESVLSDRTFRNSAMAQDKGGLVDAIKSQLEVFKENNPNGMTVKNVEQFNQWLNQNWSPSNAKIIAAVRNAADEAVTKGVGEDLYGHARQLHQLEKQTLDNPNGIAKLMDFDPQTPINRVTPHNKSPDTVANLPPAQFKNVIDTLDNMPSELAPLAKQAKAEIQSQYANKLLAAGADNKGQWNAKRVTDFRRSNNANINTAFASNPDALSMLNDLQSAGHILDFPSSYPGASAQAAQVLKRGIMSNIVQKVGSTTGAGVGAVFGPLGSAGGAIVGDQIGAKVGAGMGEKAAMKRWQSGVTKLSEFPK